MSGYKYNGVDLADIFQLNESLPISDTANGNRFDVISGSSSSENTVGLKSSNMGNDIIYGVNAPDKTNAQVYIAETHYNNNIPYKWYGNANIGENTMVSYKIEKVDGTQITPPNGNISDVNRIQCLLIGGGGGIGGKGGDAKAKANASGNSATGHGAVGGDGGNGIRLVQEIARTDSAFNGNNGESFDSLFVQIGTAGGNGANGENQSKSASWPNKTKAEGKTGLQGGNGNETYIFSKDNNGGKTLITNNADGGNGGNGGGHGTAYVNSNSNTKSNQGSPGNQGTEGNDGTISKNANWKGNDGDNFGKYGIGGTQNRSAGAGAAIIVFLYD